MHEDELFHKNLLYGFIFSILGVFLVIFNGKYFLDLNPTGDILAFICAIIFAIYSNLLKKTNNKSKQLFVIRKIFFYGIITMISAYIFLDEKINIFMIVGGILILFGVYLSDRQKF